MSTPKTTLLVCAIFALGIVARPVFAQSCDAPPLFDLSGTICSAGRQDVQCACSECLTWDPALGATWYEVRRCDGTGANCMIVGDTRWRNRGAQIATTWCAPWDNPFPALGASYDYAIRACTDGPSGPVCSSQLSNSVGYVAAPYMCINNGIEVACTQNTTPIFVTDFNGNGLTDGVDTDDDGDGIPDRIDNCPLTVNLGQRDADRDGVGDACDGAPLTPGSKPADRDSDQIGDRVDACLSVYDPLQIDTDHDRTGDACDNCPSAFNERQTDTDGDGEGDRCDLDDGTIYPVWSSRSTMVWAPETGFLTWCVYRGDLAELKRSRTYTQTPGSNPLAARFCTLASAAITDTVIPASGKAAFYLVGGRPGSWQDDLGVDSAGAMRTNTNPCP
jgi:hypothetical protein